MINKTNKNNPVGEKQTGKAGLDKAGHKTDDDPTYGNEPTQN